MQRECDDNNETNDEHILLGDTLAVNELSNK